jgi:hypothetical protein
MSLIPADAINKVIIDLPTGGMKDACDHLKKQSFSASIPAVQDPTITRLNRP